MEISPVDFDTSSPLYEDPPLKSWEKVGEAALDVFLVIATLALIPAVFKKKRTVAPILLTNAPAAVIEAPEMAPAPRCEPEEKSKVEEILNTTAAGGWPLVSKAWRLKQLGNDIDHLHPFAFLLAAPKESMREILQKGNRLAKGSVIGGIVKGLERGNLSPFIPSFAKEMEKDPKTVERLIQTRSWHELIDYLFLI